MRARYLSLETAEAIDAVEAGDAPLSTRLLTVTEVDDIAPATAASVDPAAETNVVTASNDLIDGTIPTAELPVLDQIQLLGGTLSLLDVLTYDHPIVADPSPSNQTLVGSRDDDRIEGAEGADVIYGLEGNDTLLGFDGNDRLEGNAGDDILYGSDGHDTVNGASGNDDLHGGFGDDVIDGGLGDDQLYADGGNDLLMAGDGNDIAWGHGGNDVMYGGDGNDNLYGGASTDTLYGDGGDDGLHGEDGHDSLFGGNGFDFLWGDEGNDALLGGGSGDYLEGGAGDDRLYGEAGDDVLNGGRGNDMLYGGAGRDRFVFSDLPDNDVIMDFKQHSPGTTDFQGDIIDLSAMMDQFTNFTGTNANEAWAQGYLSLVTYGTPGTSDFGTNVYIDANGREPGSYGIKVLSIQGVAADQIGAIDGEFFGYQHNILV